MAYLNTDCIGERYLCFSAPTGGVTENLYTADQLRAAIDRARGKGVQGEACVACEDKPAPGNNPCGWCGRTTPPSAPVAAIRFALNDLDGMTFLRLWNEGEFDTIRREWPEAPSSIYIGADPLATQQQETEPDREKLVEALEDIRSLSSINLAMPPNPFVLTAMLGDIHQIADATIEAHRKQGDKQ
jgi:hypothetical protein